MQTILKKTISHTMYHRDVPVFTYTINYPFFSSSCSDSCAHNINCYYVRSSKEKEQYCLSVLYPQALENAQYIPSNEPPYYSYEFLSDYKVPYNLGCITSLFFDEYTFMGGAHGSTLRKSDTWNFSTGQKMKLKDFFPFSSRLPEDLYADMEAEIAERLNESPGSYFEDYPNLLRKNFNSESFYLSPEGIIIYYQQYDIAPYSTGLPEFLFRFSL